MTTNRVAGAFGAALVLSVSLVLAPFAYADHAWGSYHWARTSNPFTVKLADNLSSSWDPYLKVAAADWSASSVLDVSVVAGMNNPKNCRPTLGRAEACNAKYGYNGWLGIAQVWVSGGHITQGVVKMNDTYFASKSYNKPAWRQLVLCQEIGHIFGLDHQDEDMGNANLGTCMDYTRDPSSNQHPNAHDHEMLETIYAHLDSSTTLSQQTTKNKAPAASDDLREWGREIRRSRDGRASLFEREVDGETMFTHVFWAEDSADDRFSRLR